MEPGTGSLEICMAKRANMEAIFHSVADGILTVDRDILVTNVNRAASTMLGLSPEKILGEHLKEVLPGTLWDPTGLLEEVLAKGQGVRERENIIPRRDGAELRLLLSINRLTDREENTAGAVIIFRNITHVRELEVRLEERTSLHSLVGKSHAMQEIFSLIDQVAPTDSTILIEGESGTGKELIADAIHRGSRRQNGPFVKVNCSALSEGVLESELFGHVKGAFTGAIADRQGRFERADGGTIFLDEIGDLTERIQVKLLRVLEEREIERVGDSRTIKIDTRVLAATHRHLKDLVAEGRFRRDLYYRLNVIPLLVPPLRERREDVPPLASVFLETFAGRLGKGRPKFSPDAWRALLDYDWPGNVRELRNAVEHAIVKAQGPWLLVEDLPRDIVAQTARVSDHAERAMPKASWRRQPELEERAILEALRKTGGHRGKAAKLLGMDRATLWRKMRRRGLA